MTRNFYNLPPAWNPRYAIPDYVMAEPPARGAFVTAQLPRGTISQVPRDLKDSYNPRFSVPKYIQDEPYGGNSITTAWLPRGTISQRVPEFSAMSAGRKLLDRMDAGLGSLGDDTLGAGVGKGASDPITKYGQDAATWIMQSIQRVPVGERSMALRALFDAVDKTLWGSVQTKATELQRKGLPAKQALHDAIALSMSAGMMKELIATGRNGKPMKSSGHVALGADPNARFRTQRFALEALGFSFGDLNPVKIVKTVGGAIKDASTTVAGAISDAATATGGAIKDATLATGGFIKDGVNALGSLACKVVQSPAGQQAAASAPQAGPYGVAAGAGAGILSSACGKSASAQFQPSPAPPPRPSLPAWVMPAALGVGIFGVGALLLRRK